MEKAAKGEDASESDSDEDSKSNSVKQEKKKVMSLADEQRQAKEEFLRAFAAMEAGEVNEEQGKQYIPHYISAISIVTIRSGLANNPPIFRSND